MCGSSGSLKHIGKCTLITEDTDYFAGGFMFILRTKENTNINPIYVNNYLNLEQTKSFFRENATGSNINNLNNKISEIQIPLPSVSVQKEFIDFFNTKNQEIDKLNDEIRKLESKKDNLLRKYFD